MSNFPYYFFDEQAYYEGEEGFYDELEGVYDELRGEGESTDDEEDEEDEDEEEEEEEEEEEDTEGEEDEDNAPPTETAATVLTNRSSTAADPPIVEGGGRVTNQIPENVVEIIDDDVEDNGGRGGGGGGEASCSSSQGTEKEGVTRTRGETNGNDTDGVCCSICMEPWSSEGDHQISCLPCGHLYGLSCIQKWLRQSRYPKCPQCGRKCTVKNIIRLYVSRLAVTDGEQEKKLLSLQAENEFLKMKIANLLEKIQHDKEEKLKEKEVSCLKKASCGEMRRSSSEFISGTGFSQSQSQMQSGRSFHLNPVSQGSPLCSFVLEDELVVDGARLFDIDASNDILIIARRLSGMGGTHVLTKMSLMYPYESENIPLPPSTKAVKDLHVAPSGRLALFASLGKKLSILSTESNNIVLTYELPVPAWSCSWDLSCPHHLYAGLQNGMIMVFDMRQTAGPLESMNGLTFHPVHSLHSLSKNSPVANGIRPLLSASSIGPCVWNTGGTGERPYLVSDLDNEGVCISLAYSPLSEDIVASFRPKVQISNDIIGTQSSLSPSQTALGQGVPGSHILIKRVGGSCYQKLGSTSANVNGIRMTKSAIINIQNCNTLFAYGDEVTRGLSLQELPSLRVVQNLNRNQHPILDVKYAGSSRTGVLGCISEDKLQLFSVKQH